MYARLIQGEVLSGFLEASTAINRPWVVPGDCENFRWVHQTIKQIIRTTEATRAHRNKVSQRPL